MMIRLVRFAEKADGQQEVQAGSGEAAVDYRVVFGLLAAGSVQHWVAGQWCPEFDQAGSLVQASQVWGKGISFGQQS